MVGDPSKYAAPADAAEFYRQDGAYVQGLVRKLLGGSGNYQDAEDAAADIMERLLVAVNDQGENALRQYHPDFTSERTGQRVTWRAFLSGKVALYTRGKREQVARRSGRELLLCDSPAGDSGTRWVDLFGGEKWDDYPSLTDDEVYERMRDQLAMLPDTWDGPASLFAVFNEIVEQVRDGGNGLAGLRQLGLTKADAKAAIGRIRDVVSDSPLPPGKFTVMGVELTASELREAADLLKAGKGNHVHRPLAGHRLQQEAPKGWYHQFSAEEKRLYPGCDIPAGTHSKPADHVKRAVIHRLERMLAEAGGYVPAPEPDPEPDVSREELLEAELWHIKGLDGDGVDAVLAAVRKLYQ